MVFMVFVKCPEIARNVQLDFIDKLENVCMWKLSGVAFSGTEMERSECGKEREREIANKLSLKCSLGIAMAVNIRLFQFEIYPTEWEAQNVWICGRWSDKWM